MTEEHEADAADHESGSLPDPGRRLARRIIGGGAVLFWIVQIALTFGGGLPLVDSIAVAALLVLLPMLSFAQLPLIETAEIEREQAYVASITTLWFLGTACWLVGTREGGAAAIGLTGLPLLPLVGWSLGLTAGALVVIVVFRAVGQAVGHRDTPLLHALLPRTPRECGLFGVLSLAAGSGEEVAYRGYLIPVLAPLTGLLPAAVLSTVVFGLLHLYQGWLGVLRTGVMGALLAAGFLASGSLWPPIIAHVLIDVLAGIVLGERLLSPTVPSRVSSADEPPLPPA